MKISRIIKKNLLKIIGVILAIVILGFSFLYLMGTSLFYFLIAISFIVGGLPFFVSVIIESRTTMEKDEFKREVEELRVWFVLMDLWHQ